MPKSSGTRQRSAWGVALAVMLCAFIFCGCGGVEAAPTPSMTEPEPTRLQSEVSTAAPEPGVSATRNIALSPDMFSGQPAAAGTQAASAATSSAAANAAATPSSIEDGRIRMRGVWIASVLNIDWPMEPGQDEEAVKEQFRTILNNMVAWNLDAAIVQVRPMADALYRSDINPWSHYLTGAQGEDPGWDPLAFAIEEAHSRGISLHAWLNPYRVTHTSVHFTEQDFAEGTIAREHPEWLIEHGGALYYDPAREEIKQHIADTVKEIVDRYDVDGIAFDDYFYPTEYPLPDGADPDGILGQERRANVNDMLRRVHEVCQNASHPVVFGVSPFGIWKNSATDPAGSDTNGLESYYAMAADSVRWIREGIVDYIAPQLYWPIGHDKADYDTLAHWWAQQVDGTDVSLLIGQDVHTDETVANIDAQLALNQTIPQITGSIFFSYKDLAANEALADGIAAFYATERNAGSVSSLEQSEMAGSTAEDTDSAPQQSEAASST